MKRKLIRIILASLIVTGSLAIMPSCAQMTPQQVQIIAATTAATVAIAGTTAQAFPNKHINPQQVQAITNAAVQASQVIGQAAANWTTPTPAPSASPH